MMAILQEQYVIIPSQNDIAEIISTIINNEPWLEDLSVKIQLEQLGIVSQYNIVQLLKEKLHLFSYCCRQHIISQNIHKIDIISNNKMIVVSILNGVFTKKSRITRIIREKIKKLLISESNIAKIKQYQKWLDQEL
ncbi:Hypothetical_protein [Hexamita inflata]|uniref:Hypothetical_protein n=1 Tax=Hexamita inflata TaxID=28002 RepID=A0AA86QIE8_9EUKA|nr:Hypothetical protein HINF_LOCUS44502 [Hexamita inflata]